MILGARRVRRRLIDRMTLVVGPVVPVARTNASWIQRHELMFVQPDGTIPRSLMYDFEHPTPMGHRVWAEAIEPKVAELMGDKPIAPMP